jgi:hypothetical protein
MDVVVWIGLGFCVFVLAILVWQDLPLLRARRLRTKGTVFDHRRSVDDGAAYHMARISFTDEAGRRVEIEDGVGYPVPRPPVGTGVTVVYPAGSPDKGRVRRYWLRPLLYGVMLFLIAVMIGKLTGRLGP